MESARPARVLVTLLALVAGPARAVDMTGPWHEHIVLVENPSYTADRIVSFTQTGTSLTSSDGYSGTIDPDTGSFSMTSMTHPGQACPDWTLDGVVQPSGTTFTASVAGWIMLGPPRPGCYLVHDDVSGTRCGDGVLEPGEACDDGNIVDGDCCSADCQRPSADGVPCDDGLFCTGADSCSAGACVAHAGDPCVGGAKCADVCDEDANRCARSAGTPCTDDGLGCTADTCDGAGACMHTLIEGRSVGCSPCRACDASGQCAPRPRTTPGCGPAAISRLDVHNTTPDSGDSLKWTWTSSGGVAAAEFGDPTATEDYALCIFDESTASPGLLLEADVPAGGTCGTRPCWQRVGKPPGAGGAKYKSRAGTPDGVATVLLTPGATLKARIKLTGKGMLLPLPEPPSAFPVPLRVQLQARSGGCWEATFSTPTVNDGKRFRGVAP